MKRALILAFATVALCAAGVQGGSVLARPAHAQKAAAQHAKPHKVQQHQKKHKAGANHKVHKAAKGAKAHHRKKHGK